MSWYLELFFDVLVALVILAAALWGAGFVRDAIMRAGRRYEQLDETLFSFLASFARYGIIGLAAVFVLARFGIQTTSLIALIGAAGLAVGLALQGTLSNLAAGVMLLIFRPFKLGDYITAAGHSGTVKAITLFTTELATPDNVQIIVPNGDIWAASITNFSHHSTRRVDLVFGVSYDSGLKQAETLIRTVVAADDRVHTSPEPFVKVTGLGDFAVDFTLRAWTDSVDYWDVRFDLTRAIKEAFDQGGVQIPYPTRTNISVSAPGEKTTSRRKSAPRD